MTPEQFDKLAAKFTSVLPKPALSGGPIYTSESDIRERVMAQLTGKKDKSGVTMLGFRKVSDADRIRIAEAWIAKNIEYAKKSNRFLSPQQYSDWRIGRRLVAGDRARFIGETRDEKLSAGIVVTRPNGQIGVIVNVEEERGSRLLTFHPDDAVEPVGGGEKQTVQLVVREHTADWLALERIPIE